VDTLSFISEVADEWSPYSLGNSTLVSTVGPRDGLDDKEKLMLLPLVGVEHPTPRSSSP
jgi:hypothetical protein